MAQPWLGSTVKTRFQSLVATFAAAIVVAIGVGCQTSRLKEFETVHGGMTKDQVLELVGGPQRTQRWHGRDRWNTASTTRAKAT